MKQINKKLKEHLESYNPPRLKVNAGNCILLMEWSWKEAQKELLEELKTDFAEGNPAEEICMKFIDKLREL